MCRDLDGEVYRTDLPLSAWGADVEKAVSRGVGEVDGRLSAWWAYAEVDLGEVAESEVRDG